MLHNPHFRLFELEIIIATFDHAHNIIEGSSQISSMTQEIERLDFENCHQNAVSSSLA